MSNHYCERMLPTKILGIGKEKGRNRSVNSRSQRPSSTDVEAIGTVCSH